MKYYADFESPTKTINDRVDIYLWGLVSEDNSYREYGISIETFFYTISQLNSNSIIYFHNISWDGVFIIHYLIDIGYEFCNNVTFKTPDKNFSWTADYNTNIYNIKIKIKNKIIILYDSLKILVSSVSSLGKVLNLPKLEIDYNEYTKFNSKEEVPKIVVDYLFRDIDIVKDFMNNFSKKISNIKSTIASTMYSDFIKYYGVGSFTRDFGAPFLRGNVLTTEQWEHIKLSYNGGFTAISPRYVGVDIKDIDGYSYDWNSMYPSIMLNYKIPYGSPYDERISEDDLELMDIRIIRAQKMEPLMPNILPNGSEGVKLGKYVDIAVDSDIVIWREEWEEILKSYSIKYIHKSSMFFKSKYVFREYISRIKDEKVNATNPVDRYISKIKQNSLYGKFGQSMKRVSKVLKYDPDKKLLGKRYGSNQMWVEVKEITEDKNMSYIPIASYITSKARSLLYKAIYDNKLSFIYCDTDSLYLTSKGINLKIDDKEYGALKLEHRFNRFKSIKLKCYMINDINEGLIVRVAGLPEAAQSQLNFDNFYKGYKLDKSKLQKKHHIGGLILEDVDYTL